MLDKLPRFIWYPLMLVVGNLYWATERPNKFVSWVWRNL